MKVLISLAAILFYQYTTAQSFNNTALFTTQNGLSNNTISCLEKDEDGFLWIGTHEGLNQYDGTEFINVLSNTKNNLPSNSINKICCLNKTTLAVATSSGLCLLNTKTLEGKRILIQENTAPADLIPYDILYDKIRQELWVGAAGGIYVLSAEGKLKKKIIANKADKATGIFALFLLKDKFNNVFFFSQKQNGFFYPDFTKEKLVPIETRLPELPLNALAKKKYFLRGVTFIDDKIICCYSSQNTSADYSIVAFYDNKKGNGFIDSLSTGLSNKIFVFNGFPLNDSILLLNSYFGEPHLLNLRTRKVKPAAGNPLWFASWPDGIAVRLLVDKENIWATTTKGLMQIPQYPQLFATNTALVNGINVNNNLIFYNYGIYHQNKFWLSCQGAGLFSLDTVANTIGRVFDKSTPAKFKSKIISNELAISGNELWLFSIYGPARVNVSTMKLSYVEAKNKDSLFDDKAGSPLKDSKGNIWLSMPNGITKYAPATNDFTGYKSKSFGGSFPMEKSYYKTEDGKGDIWFARQDTLVKFDPVAQTFSLHFIKKNGLPVRPVQALASDGNDILYMCVHGAFAIYHISTDSVELFTKQTGIVSTFINQIITDKYGNPWMATESGLVYYNNAIKRFYSYSMADGLPDDNVVSINFTDDKKNTLFLGFPKSYCLFDPGVLLAKRTDAVQNMITGVEVNGRAIAFDEAKTFTYKENSVSFYYTGINFKAGRQNSYAYMLKGVDAEWKYCGNKRQCNYINLPPGNYTFKIKSANQQGEWNETAASFSFTIAAPFWQTFWFRLLMIIIAVLLIYWFIKRRDRFKEKENKAALQMSELKLTALQSQMNPHFIFNSLNSIQNYILQQKPVDAARYLSKFSKLMRRILDQSFNTLTSLNEIVETLRMYMELEAFRFSNEFSWEINVDDADSINDVKLPALLLQPYVENAIIHGLMPKEGEKHLMIHLYKKDNVLHCVVDDNGVGRGNKLTNTDGHISRGQKLTDDMLATMKQLLHTDASIVITDKKDEQDDPAGTRVDLIIPLHR